MPPRLACTLFCPVFVLALALAAPGVAERPRSVSVSVDAGWPSSPAWRTLEAAELLSQRDPSLFWSFVNAHLGEAEGSVDALEVAEVLTDAIALRLLNLSLSVRAGSAAVELHRQLADADGGRDTCAGGAWVRVCGASSAETPGVGGSVACSTADLKEQLRTARQGDGETEAECSRVYDFDHVIDTVGGSSGDSAPVVVLYGTIGESQWQQFHEELLELAEDGQLRYVMRHAPPRGSDEPTLLRGFGVLLDIKNMEYKALDDRAPAPDAQDEEPEADVVDEGDEVPIEGILFDTLASRRPDLTEQLAAAKNELLSAASGDEDDLKVWDMQDLGLQAVAYIAASREGEGKDALRSLQYLTGNFPATARWLSKSSVPKALRDEVAHNARFVQPGSNQVAINGIPINLADATFNLFSLLKRFEGETEVQAELARLPLMPRSRAELARLRVGGDTYTNPVRIETRKKTKGVVWYMNNIEKDPNFARWPSEINGVLQHTWQLHQIRKNLYTLVFVLDPTTNAGAAAVSSLFKYVRMGAPLRFGLVIVDKAMAEAAAEGATKMDLSTEPRDIATAAHIAMLLRGATQHGADAAWTFLRTLTTSPPPYTIKEASGAFATAVKAATGAWTMSAAEEEARAALTDDTGDGMNTVIGSGRFVHVRGLPTSGCTLVNGRLVDSIDIQEAMPLVYADLSVIQSMVQRGDLKDGDNVYAKLIKGTRTLPRYNEGVMGAEEFVPLLSDDGEAVLSSVNWAHASGTAETTKVVSLLLSANLDTAAGLASLRALVEAHAAGGTSTATSSRFSVVHTGASSSQSVTTVGDAVVRAFQSAANDDNVVQFMLEVIDAAQSATDVDSLSSTVLSLSEGTLEAAAQSDVRAALSDGGAVVDSVALAAHHMSRLIGASDDDVVVANGRVIRTSELGEVPLAADFELLVAYEKMQRADTVEEFVASASLAGLDHSSISPRQTSDLIMRCGAAIGRYDPSGRSWLPLAHMSGEHTRISPKSGNDDSPFIVEAILDPLSEDAQRAAPLLLMLRDELGAKVSVQLTPATDVSELPLKSFYRFVAGGNRSSALFSRVPPQLLTMKIVTPEPWIVQATTAPYDLDNLRYGDPNFGPSSGVMNVQFTLKSILVAGQCDDLTHNQPPNGLQLELVTPGDDQPRADTLVMQNLGYFQLQAGPGVWDIRLAPGRGRDLYEIVSSEGGDGGLQWLGRHSADKDADDSARAVESKRAIVRDFTGPITQLRVRKRHGKEGEPLLEPPAEDNEEASNSIWSSLFGSAEVEETTDDDTIHVFSLASGHLYERFLRIMMLSVVKRASLPVKFWLVENFLSPAFKEFVPRMAKEYGFEVGFVTYKWPNWLRQQTEKQRIIWGYKILFLDVLFPLNVKKVIYVDADQVVRADLRELWDMDLQGHAYGYTPFCTSREETLGFQFWQQGYWKDHLGERPYHISALYVVDLVRFRQRAVGDQLRSIYDNLSRDPNSLANLDQDLPNYAQNVVPIFSLPIEWLWCESWCSDDTKFMSKTIDLCNNPLHKEPKLDMARRVIDGDLFPETWVELDDELASLEQRFSDADAAALPSGVKVVDDAVADVEVDANGHTGEL